MEHREHPYIRTLKENFAERRIDRREFLRTSTLLGLSATAAYAFVGDVGGGPLARPAKAAMSKGGTIKIGHRVQEIENPPHLRLVSVQHHAAGLRVSDAHGFRQRDETEPRE